MKIVCPECQKENNIVVTGGTSCQHCEKPLDDYRFLKPLIPAFLLLVMGFGGSHAYEYISGEDRYPIVTEHSIVEHCTSADSSTIKHLLFKKKNRVCACALEETQEDFSYSDFGDDQAAFMRAFRKNTRVCANK